MVHSEPPGFNTKLIGMKTNKNGLKKLAIRFSTPHRGWVVEGVSGCRCIFESAQMAERYCVNQWGQMPRVVRGNTQRYQELPRSSVWTGAPWDRTFARLR